MKKSHYTIRAFTLIEMLVVIAIIAILTGIVITNLTSSRAKARDAERISDVNHIQLALELYFDRCHRYPVSNYNKIDSSVLGDPSGCPIGSDITLGSYISAIPKSPAGGSIPAGSYDYAINDYPQSTDYVLHATLESSNGAQANSFTKPTTGWYTNITSFSCYDGNTSSLDYCVSPK